MAPFGAASVLLRAPRAWPFALVPALVFVALESAVVLVAWRYVKPWVALQLTGVDVWQIVAAHVASWLSTLFVVVLGWLLSLQLAPALSAPALERIVGVVEQGLGAPPRPALGFVAELGCGLRATVTSLAVTLPLIVGLSLLELVASPVAVVTTPLKLLIGALGLAWSLFDYPLTLRGMRVAERLRFARRHFSAVLGFGLAFSLLFWVPCLAVLMLPLGVAGATRLYWQIERASLEASRSSPQIG